MEEQGKKIKINEDNYGVAFGDVLDITNKEIKILGSMNFMQDAILAAKKEQLKYIVGKTFTSPLEDGILKNCFNGIGYVNRIDFSENKKDWHKPNEPINDERLKENQQVYFRYRV